MKSEIQLTKVILESCNIPRAFWEMGADTYPGDQNALRMCEKYIEKMEVMYSTGGGLCLRGMRESGRTFLMTYVLKCLIAKGYGVYYLTLDDLTNALLSRSAEVDIAATLSVEILGIDNINILATKGDQIALKRVLADRADRLAPTLIATDLDEPKFEGLFEVSREKSGVLVECSIPRSTVMRKRAAQRERLK